MKTNPEHTSQMLRNLRVALANNFFESRNGGKSAEQADKDEEYRTNADIINMLVDFLYEYSPESEIAALVPSRVGVIMDELCKDESDEQKSDVFLIVREENTTRLYKNGVKLSPKQFTEFYGCEMTDEQKKLLEIAKQQYFEALSDTPSQTAEEIFKEFLKTVHSYSHSTSDRENPSYRIEYKDLLRLVKYASLHKPKEVRFHGRKNPEDVNPYDARDSKRKRIK